MISSVTPPPPGTHFPPPTGGLVRRGGDGYRLEPRSATA